MSKDTRIYIGNLPQDVRNKDIEDLFYKYGKIKFIDLKNRKGPPFAFVEFDDPLDAEDAVRGRDNYLYEGNKLRVEFQKGPRNRAAAGPRSGPPTRRSDYRCIITGLPPTGSWQDLKDHMREAGTVCYADVFKDGTGVVEFVRYEDMKYAVKNLDDTKFRSHEGETSYVRVRADMKGGNRSRSRSRSRSTSRVRGRERGSPTYSPVRRSRSRSNSLDDSRRKRPRKSISRSRSRSKSRSYKSRSPVPKSVSRSRSRSFSKRKSLSKSRSNSRSRSRSPNFKKSDENGEPNTENGTNNERNSKTRSRSRSRSPDN
ncbi:unnamed protein product [Brachionus calyciflorus]|uniref:RRM domain-containing protein n=1 Tax=Brachionus calyciflorus TaxID=104777 RepID=A0A814ACE6_9BILA|nr:unnamed protein product [Brachionus calyciflorus]